LSKIGKKGKRSRRGKTLFRWKKSRSGGRGQYEKKGGENKPERKNLYQIDKPSDISKALFKRGMLVKIAKRRRNVSLQVATNLSGDGHSFE